MDQLVQKIAHDNRHEILELIHAGKIPSADRDGLMLVVGIDAGTIEQILDRILAGERPFEDWMHAHGRSDEEILKVYRWIDDWLLHERVPPGRWKPPEGH